MALEDIVKAAMEREPLKIKEAFESEMETRIMAALEEKYKTALKEADEDEDEDDDEDDEDEDEDEDDD